MRVAMICPYSLSRPGGVQGQAIGLAAALRRRGHQVWLLAPGQAAERGADTWLGVDPLTHGSGTSDHGGTVVVARPVPVPANGSVAPLALWPPASRRARHIVQEIGAQIAHLHEPFAPVLGYSLMSRPVAPLIATFHRAGMGAGYRLVMPFARRLGSRIAIRCAVSEAALQTAGEVVTGPFELLFNGVDIDALSGAREGLEALEGGGSGDAGGAGDAVPIFFIGRHEPRKGLLPLLEAFARIADESDVILWIGGNGPMTKELRRRFPQSARVQWLGVLSEEEKLRRLRAAKILCAPALGGESFGMVVIEGLAARCVVLCSDIPGYREATEGHAELVDPGDVSAWSSAIAQSVRDARLGTGRSDASALDAGFNHAASRSMDHLAVCYEERYRRVLAGK